LTAGWELMIKQLHVKVAHTGANNEKRHAEDAFARKLHDDLSTRRFRSWIRHQQQGQR
jgi:hypothetical protein